MPEAAREGMITHATQTLPVGRSVVSVRLATFQLLMVSTYATGAFLDQLVSARLGG